MFLFYRTKRRLARNFNISSVLNVSLFLFAHHFPWSTAAHGWSTCVMKAFLLQGALCTRTTGPQDHRGLTGPQTAPCFLFVTTRRTWNQNAVFSTELIWTGPHRRVPAVLRLFYCFVFRLAPFRKMDPMLLFCVFYDNLNVSSVFLSFVTMVRSVRVSVLEE